MSPKSDSGRVSTPQRSQPSRSASQPYPSSTTQRRSSAQPKSSRQQFSACGACRMRRVRCDLKDLQASNPSAGLTSCSNCQERGLKCVDEFAEVKAVKLLRRGRRLQQVEAVYGKASSGADGDRLYSPPPCTIPQIRQEFFASAFFRRFLLQRPIIEPVEFSIRFLASGKGDGRALGDAGRLICMVLVVWAASFGVNEAGEPEPHGGHHATQRRKERVNEMLSEVLQLIDYYALLRKPTWDGVRALLLILPLTENVQTPMERLAMYEATINQVYTLCSLASVSSVGSGRGEYVDATVRARIFWYAHVHEGVTTGLRGGRLLLSEDDLLAFQATLPATPSHALVTVTNEALNFHYARQFAKTPLRISSICRMVHATLTGPKARQFDGIDEERLRQCWSALDRCWEDLAVLRNHQPTDEMQPEDVEVFISGWRILIFECHNVIREALKQRLISCTGGERSYLGARNSPRQPYLAQVYHLHAEAEQKCREVAHHVVTIVSQHRGSPLFEYDASLVRDGCFYAGVLLAGEPGRDDEVKTCIQALREMRWAFSKSEEREHALRAAWERRATGSRRGSDASDLRHQDRSRRGSGGPPSTVSADSPHSSGDGSGRTPPQHSGSGLPPPLLISHNVLVDSAPSTAVTEDGNWPAISSHCSSASASASGSPPYAAASSQLGRLGSKLEAIGAPSLLLPRAETSLAMSGLDRLDSSQANFYVSEVEHYSFPHAAATADPHERTASMRTPTGIHTNSISLGGDGYFDPSSMVYQSPISTSVEGSSSAAQAPEVGTNFHNHYGNASYFVSP